MEEKKLVPKLRFPGFTEPWEQRKLGDIATITGGGTPSTNISEYWNGDIDWYSPVEIGENRYVSGSTRKITKLGLEKSSAKILPVGTVLFTSRAGIGNTAILQVEGCTNQGFQSITPNSKALDTYFLYTMTPKLKRYGEVTGAGSTFVEVSGKQMEQMNLMIPSLEEQKCVSQLFKAMDDTITLHQRKLEHLKLKKKSLLQKLFPKEGEVYPELRFPGFTDPWEQCKLCQITTRVTRKNGGQSDLPLTISAQDGLVDQRKYFNRQVASRDMSNYYLIKKGEFAYNKSYSEGYPFGAVKRLDYYDIGALSTLYILFEITDNNISSDFIVSYYMTHLWYKEISKRAAEGARNHGLLNISTEDFFDSELNIPNSIEEQIKIGNFIKQFDKFITLHQRKLEHLQLLKKALLQQLFV